MNSNKKKKQKSKLKRYKFKKKNSRTTPQNKQDPDSKNFTSSDRNNYRHILKKKWNKSRGNKQGNSNEKYLESLEN